MALNQKSQFRDLQTLPFVMIPKAFFTRFRPSSTAILTYIALKYFCLNRTGTTEFTSIPTMAALVDLSESSFKRAIHELLKKGAVRVRRRTRKMPSGQKQSLPNLYEIIDLNTAKGDDAPI